MVNLVSNFLANVVTYFLANFVCFWLCAMYAGGTSGGGGAGNSRYDIKDPIDVSQIREQSYWQSYGQSYREAYRQSKHTYIQENRQ